METINPGDWTRAISFVHNMIVSRGKLPSFSMFYTKIKSRWGDFEYIIAAETQKVLKDVDRRAIWGWICLYHLRKYALYT